MIKTGIFFQSFGYDNTESEIMRSIANAGFDTVSTGFGEAETLERLSTLAKEYGLIYESIHAPFGGVSDIWNDGEEGEAWVERLNEVTRVCAKLGIGYYTLHCTNADEFNHTDTYKSQFSEIGLERFGRIVGYAAELGVTASFENVEFPQLELTSLAESLRRSHPSGWGITWDIGHWRCWQADIDFAEVFGDKAVGTHIHDNFGAKDPQIMTWNDDFHLLPFDGTADYREAAKALKKIGYSGTLTLEIARSTRMPWYSDYADIDAYLRDAHERAYRIARLCE